MHRSESGELICPTCVFKLLILAIRVQVINFFVWSWKRTDQTHLLNPQKTKLVTSRIWTRDLSGCNRLLCHWANATHHATNQPVNTMNLLVCIRKTCLDLFSCQVNECWAGQSISKDHDNKVIQHCDDGKSPYGPMDKAPAYGAGDSGFESR